LFGKAFSLDTIIDVKKKVRIFGTKKKEKEKVVWKSETVLFYSDFFI
jgi:hypothetical protein